MPDLGTCTGQQVAALVGVAPFNRDNGAWRGPRRVWGGRAQVRAVPHMATVAAIRVSPRLLACYHHLHVAQGGPDRLYAQAAGALQRRVSAPDHVGPDYGLTLDAPTQLLTELGRRRPNLPLRQARGKNGVA